MVTPEMRPPVVPQLISLLALLALLISSPSVANASDGTKGRRCQRPYDLASKEDAAERALLAKHAAFIKRVGDTLELTTRRGVLKLEDVCDEIREAERVSYQFVDYFGDLDHALIKESYYEGRGYSLIGMKYGAREKIDAMPLFSPDRIHFVTVDIADAHSANRLQVWRRHGQQDWFEMVWSFWPYEYWAGASARWRDDRTIEVTKQISAKPQGQGYVGKSFYIRLGTDGWRIEDVPRRAK